jgi:hypothetical protein
MGPSVLTLARATPSCKGIGLALGFGLTPRSKTLWIRESTSTALNSSTKGWSSQLGSRYKYILVFRYWSGWIRRRKNVRMRCAPINRSYHNCGRDSHIGCNLSTSSLATPSVIPRSEKEGTKPPYVCPGCSNHTYSNNMITRFHVQ